MSTPTPRESTSESLFAVWLERVEDGEQADLEELCRAHPQHASTLRALHRRWRRFQGEWERAVRDREVADTLESEATARADCSSDVLSRLAGKPAATTRYSVRGEVARGGMAAVLRVWDEELNRPLAMKVMLGPGDSRATGDTPAVDVRRLARFLEEAQVTGRLDHPGIVPVHELGLNAEGRVFFTMKLVEGRTLSQVFAELARGEGSWTQTSVLGLLQKVCEAMSYAHAKGVIHRDLKPSNVMVGRFGEVYVMDWGLAKVLGQQNGEAIDPRATEGREPPNGGDAHGSPLRTMEGDVLGTPAYMPPEQARGDLAAMGAHSDVYAVGAMLYHLLTGHMPYASDGETPSSREVWKRVREGPPESLHEVAPEAPPELVAMCERAMEREGDRRYPDMSALSADLAAYLEGRVVQAYEAGAWAEARKWVRRNRPLAASLAAAVALLVAGLVSSLVLKAQSDANADRAAAKTREAQENLVLALDKEQEAQVQQQRAEESARRAREETAKVLRLSDVKIVQQLEEGADDLWPAYPDRIDELESWLARARRLVERLPEHSEALAEMRAGALPWSPEEEARDRETHPRAWELANKEQELEWVSTNPDAARGQSREPVDKRIARLEAEIEDLDLEVGARRTWSFASAEEQWQHDVLEELVDGMERLEAGLMTEDAVSAGHGWGVPKRLEQALELERLFDHGGDHYGAWAEALPAIRETYPGLELSPQVGLLPIGPDPDSGLWEFAHLLTGEPAQRGADGRLVLTDETGVVLVLLPGGFFWMGAQPDDPDGRNHDPLSTAVVEHPVHEVELSPFFIAKHEMTQGQWERMSGANPSFYAERVPLANVPGGWDAPSQLNPVETVSWDECMTWLPRVGLRLPSEAEWEYGARGGTETPWWTGAEREALAEHHAANLADRAATRVSAQWPAIADWPELDDEYPVYAPVGTFSANPFGLHEVHGNVHEWCLDGAIGEYYAVSPLKDPIAPVQRSTLRVFRGGSFQTNAKQARSAQRNILTPSHAGDDVGVRPASVVER